LVFGAGETPGSGTKWRRTGRGQKSPTPKTSEARDKSIWSERDGYPMIKNLKTLMQS
jgi:hypothetical protein